MTAQVENHVEEKSGKATEHEVWEGMLPKAWHDSVASEDSIFQATYKVTREQVEETAKRGNYDCIIEVGCGTGDVIGELDVNIQCYGLDINPMFIDFCNDNHPHDHCEFLVHDATDLMSWWKPLQAKHNYKKPLVLCVNNTFNIMPKEIRGDVISQLLLVTGAEGRCLISWWNGTFFSHAIMNYYKKNEPLCGAFDMSHVDWDHNHLITPTGYSTEWQYPSDVQKLLRALDINLDVITDFHDDYHKLLDTDHINVAGLGIFTWFSEATTSKAKGYYDSEDSQKFYKQIWGDETLHVGRYDLITPEETMALTIHEQIARAQELHELEFIRNIRSKFTDQSKIRILDMGCGFGGLLRRTWETGMVWSATGIDLAAKMCEHARVHNAKLGCADDIKILEESYLDVSVPTESMDLVISMDALLHVGPTGQIKAIKEASRVLRPGGWMIFSDIMQKEVVDPVEMQPIYDRIHLQKMGTVSNYKEAMTKFGGFTKFEFESHSSNISLHYGSVKKVLMEKGDEIGLSKEYQARMEAGLKTWEDLAPKNIEWGFIMAQKTEKVNL